jgi:hypothetical protein
MSFKSIEMQVAIPRTNDAGLMQNQLNQKPVADQSALAEQSKRLTEEQRTRSVKAESPVESRVRNEDQQRRQQGNNHSGQRQYQRDEKSSPSPSPHPYKGKHIDLSL